MRLVVTVLDSKGLQLGVGVAGKGRQLRKIFWSES